MDNKLSELSKPVMFIESAEKLKADAGLAVTAQPIKRWGADIPLYSQEYVSALLARIANLEFEQGGYGYSVLEDLNGKIKRIAELEEQRATWASRAEALGAKLDAAEKRLATPVRLKKVDSSNVPFAGDGFNAAVDYCAKAVRAAGFTVEGDE